MEKIKIVIADKSAFMRLILSDIIQTDSKFKVIYKFKTLTEIIKSFQKDSFDVLILGKDFQSEECMLIIKELKQKKISLFMLILLDSYEIYNRDFEYESITYLKNTSNMNKQLLREKILTEIYKNINSKGQKDMFSLDRDIKVNKYKSIKAIVIGASTGGPKALQVVLAQIERSINIPVFVVQHMPKGFTKGFAERLDKICPLDVVEAYDGLLIENNTIYIAPGGLHMTVGDGKKISLNTEPPIWGVRPAVDKLFDSAVDVYGGNLISAILTGMGRDGAKGTVMVKQAGGRTIAEDKSTCTIYGMPKAAYETGKVDYVLPLERIGPKITVMVREVNSIDGI